ncbi:MAG: DNA translocase FtsK 4TM domain-containing protein [Planctomycetota bacterium]|nr:DNA translocase FtsK 4TM domain-containing protein [Planctomycetota bacterium]MDA1164329.1 DNA translocase FtsK 4TM domain-containing protein [Planctomycetota bacterium]
MWDLHRIKSDLIALTLFAVTLFVGLSMLSFDPGDPPARLVHPVRELPLNLCGELGAQLAYNLRAAFGIGAWFVVLALAVFDFRLLSRGPDKAVRQKAVGALLMLGSLCVMLQLLAPDLASGQIVGSGGYLGAWGVAAFENHFATTGLLILLSSSFLSGLVLVADTGIVMRAMCFLLRPVYALPVALLAGMFRLLKRSPRSEPDEVEVDHRGALSRRNSVAVKAEEDLLEDDESEVDDEVEDLNSVSGEIRVNPPVTALSQRDEVIAKLEAASATSNNTPYTLPSLDLLEESEEFPYELLAKRARLAAVTLEKTFQEFGLNVKVVEIDTGPVITQFELELEAGLRLSKVTSLADDLAIALRVPSVRVVAPIPGKNTVGVEVPNDKRVMVRLRELIESCAKDIEDKRIPLFLGKDVSGRPLAVDMAKMPHLLIAGRTGTGKSVCLNALILSILMTRTPEQVRMLMIDPKMVELSPYKRIPHLMHPVITDMKKAEAVLGWAVEKMEERYDLLARCGVRHLDSYNKLNHETRLTRMSVDPESEEAEQIPEKMPYIVIIADEMADMMMTSGKDVEGHIIRLAQKSRAVGIHLILATQKPTVDVITGLIKSNLPARVAFQVASKSDSRVVLDVGGADKLLGNGDMLFLAPGTSNLSRAQGSFVSDEEVNSVIDYFAGYEPDYSAELARLSASGGTATRDQMKERDELYEQAIDVIVREGRGSVSLLQRALGIGYGRGARLIDFMAEDGIVGDYNGSQAREVLFTPEQWEDFKMAGGGGVVEDEPAFA